MIKTVLVSSPWGDLLLGEWQNHLCLCDWKNRINSGSILKRLRDYFISDLVEEETDLLAEARNQLNEYFRGIVRPFRLPLVTAGTDFQKDVWEALGQTGYGETLSYGELARKLSKPKAVRAVASAVGANSLSILIPCHRIIGKNGSLNGYAGGLTAKKGLLKLEGDSIQ